MLILLLTALTLAACGDGRENATAVATTYVPYENNIMGIRLEYPEGWATEESIGGLTIASSADVLTLESLAEIGNEGFIVILPIELAAFNFQTGQNIAPNDALGALNIYKMLLEQEGQSYLVERPPQALTINGQTAAVMEVTSDAGGETLRTRMVAILDEGQAVLISLATLNGADVDVISAELDHILNSVEVFQPGSA